MERENSFKSESILGKIYDEVDAYEQEDNSKKGEGLQWNHFLDRYFKWYTVKLRSFELSRHRTYVLFWYPEIHKLPCFDVEVPEVYMSKWALHYKNYREDMTDALRITERVLKNKAAEDVKKKYKMVILSKNERTGFTFSFANLLFASM